MEYFFDVWRHAFLAFNLASIAFLAAWWVGRQSFPLSDRARSLYYFSCIGILAAKFLIVLGFAAVAPGWVVHADGVRYLNEIYGISDAPWRWNPFTGTGPDYDATPKMGMSYLYGWILFVHQTKSLQAVIAINVVLSFLLALAVFRITFRLSGSATPALVAMVLVSVHPETAYWTPRVLRENLTLLLVTLVVLQGILLVRGEHVTRALFLLGFYSVALLLTRAQLIMFLPFILAYALAISAFGRFYKEALALSVIAFFALYFIWESVLSQIRAAAGGATLALLTTDVAVWMDYMTTLVAALPSVLTPFAREGHGAMGVALAPVAVPVFLLFLSGVIGFRRVFAGRCAEAGLVVFLAVAFLASLAAFELVNIRFRATVTPLIIAVASVAGWYYWRALRLPVLVIRREVDHAARLGKLPR